MGGALRQHKGEAEGPWLCRWLPAGSPGQDPTWGKHTHLKPTMGGRAGASPGCAGDARDSEVGSQAEGALRSSGVTQTVPLTCPQQTLSFLPTRSANIISPSPAGLCMGYGGEGRAFRTGDLNRYRRGEGSQEAAAAGGPPSSPPQASTWISRTCSVKSGSDLKCKEGKEPGGSGKPAEVPCHAVPLLRGTRRGPRGLGLHSVPPSGPALHAASTPRAATASRTR